eukprot:2014221-Amphidinium_carterae.1
MTVILSTLLIAVTSALIATRSSIKIFQQPVKKQLRNSATQTDRVERSYMTEVMRSDAIYVYAHGR